MRSRIDLTLQRETQLFRGCVQRDVTSEFRPSSLVITAAMVFALAGCFADPYADRVSAEDERVMRAMVDISCKLGVESIVISNRPAVPRQSSLRGAESKNVRFGIDINQRIARVARWPKGEICPFVHVVENSLIEIVLARDTKSWDKFFAAFDGARSLMRISLPVYSRDGKRAVIYTTGTCPYTCGAGFYHELEKTRSGWRIASSVNAWRS
jgi:hypothetical protein